MARDGNDDTIEVEVPPASSGQDEGNPSGGDSVPATGGGGTPQTQTPEAGKAKVSEGQQDPEFQGLIHRKKELSSTIEKLSKTEAFYKQRVEALQKAAAPSAPPAPGQAVKLSENLEPYRAELEGLAKAYAEPLREQVNELQKKHLEVEMSAWERAQAEDIQKTAQKFPDYWQHADKMNELLQSNPALYQIPKESLYKMAAFDATVERLKTDGKAAAIKDMTNSARKVTPSGSVAQQAVEPSRGLSEKAQLDADFDEAFAEVSSAS